jgi:CheY-like chemotaxis protein
VILLKGAHILVCEDEPFIALDLSESIREAGGVVVGPAASVQEALALLETHVVVGAILDVNLSDRDVTPVAERLLNEGVAVIIQSGIGAPAALRLRYPGLPAFAKPVRPDALIRKLAEMLDIDGPMPPRHPTDNP